MFWKERTKTVDQLVGKVSLCILWSRIHFLKISAYLIWENNVCIFYICDFQMWMNDKQSVIHNFQC